MLYRGRYISRYFFNFRKSMIITRGIPPCFSYGDISRPQQYALMSVCLAFCKYAIMHTVREEVRTSSGRDSLDALKREVRGTLTIKSVTAKVCRTCPFQYVYPVGRLKLPFSFSPSVSPSFQYVYPVGRLKLGNAERICRKVNFPICLSRREIETRRSLSRITRARLSNMFIPQGD